MARVYGLPCSHSYSSKSLLARVRPLPPPQSSPTPTLSLSLLPPSPPTLRAAGTPRTAAARRGGQERASLALVGLEPSRRAGVKRPRLACRGAAGPAEMVAAVAGLGKAVGSEAGERLGPQQLVDHRRFGAGMDGTLPTPTRCRGSLGSASNPSAKKFGSSTRVKHPGGGRLLQRSCVPLRRRPGSPVPTRNRPPKPVIEHVCDAVAPSEARWNGVWYQHTRRSDPLTDLVGHPKPNPSGKPGKPPPGVTGVDPNAHRPTTPKTRTSGRPTTLPYFPSIVAVRNFPILRAPVPHLVDPHTPLDSEVTFQSLPGSRRGLLAPAAQESPHGPERSGRPP